jgi:hypothetical protein
MPWQLFLQFRRNFITKNNPIPWLASWLVYITLSTSSLRGLTYQIEPNPFCHLIVPSLVQNLTNATSIRSLIKKASLLITESGKECCDNNCDYLVSDK